MANVRPYPEVQVLCYPLGARPQRAQEMFTISDVFGDLIRRNWSDQADLIEAINPLLSNSWASQPEFTSPLDGSLSFLRFYKDGSFSEGSIKAKEDRDGDDDVAGFLLKGRDGFLDCKAGFTSLDTECFDSLWETVQGDWDTVLPPDAPERTRITNRGAGLNAKARTIGTFAKNRSLRLDVRFTGILSGTPLPGWRFAWGPGGNRFSIVLRHQQAPVLERDSGSGWVVARRLDGIKSDLDNGQYVIRLRRVAGRLCISINEHHYYWLQMSGPYNKNDRARAVDVEWGEAPLQVNCYNCRMTLGVALIKYATPEDTPYSGELSRRVERATNIDESGEEPEVLSSVNGWARAGTSMSITPELSDGAVEYTCSLTASSEGLDTPFLSKAMVSYSPVWEQSDLGALNVRQALEGMRVTLAMPPLAPGATCTLELDRALLKALDSGWETYLNRYHPVEIKVRRTYEDGSADAWVNLFKGYVYHIQKSNAAYNEEKMTVVLRDPIMRLQAPAAVIDHRFPPLDLFFSYGASQLGYPAAFRYYGSDAVKDILARELGPDEADVLNGNGDGQRFFNHHYPLLSSDLDTAGLLTLDDAMNNAPTRNGFFFPPPFGDDAISWINSIGEHDRAIFFYGWPDGDTSLWPVPIYGRVLNITAGRPTHIIPDREYVSGDINKLAKAMETETRPDKDINRVLAWDAGAGGALSGIFPALRMAEARLPADDINAAELTWERTYVMRDNWFLPEGSAEAVALGLIEELTGRLMQFPKITFRGWPQVQAWDKIQIKADSSSSDSTLGLDGLTFRAERIEHNFSFGDEGDTFTTDAWLRPLSASGY